MTHAAIVVGILLASYALLWAGEYVWRLLIEAPKVIHSRCLIEVRDTGEKARAEIEKAGEDAANELASASNSFAQERARWSKGAVDMNDTLAKCREELVALKAKPIRTPAQEHYRTVALAGLAKINEDGKTMLRHLFQHGPQQFGAYSPSLLPRGILGGRAESLLNQCCEAGLVSRRNLSPVGAGTEYYLADEMKAALGELLFS